jgi:hypothetical protein
MRLFRNQSYQQFEIFSFSWSGISNISPLAKRRGRCAILDVGRLSPFWPPLPLRRGVYQTPPLVAARGAQLLCGRARQALACPLAPSRDQADAFHFPPDE